MQYNLKNLQIFLAWKFFLWIFHANSFYEFWDFLVFFYIFAIIFWLKYYYLLKFVKQLIEILMFFLLHIFFTKTNY